MSKIMRFLMLNCVLVVAACTPQKPVSTPVVFPTEESTPTLTILPLETAVINTPQTGLTMASLMNAVFLSPQFQIPVQMIDGKFSDSMNNRSSSIIQQPPMAFGDLNEDGIDDAAVLLAEDPGGSGVFVSLVVISSKNGTFTQSNGVYIDDRPFINSLEIVKGEILVNPIIHGVNDVMTDPTFDIKQNYRLLGETLTLSRQSSTNESGGERTINIDIPVEASDVTTEVQIKGSMPVSPFENNLRFRVLDLKGAEIYSSGFMVSSTEVGGPATFDNKISLPVLPSGSLIRLELSELSMADGSLVTMDSVVVRIK
jgi:hypothetical protein